MVCEHVDDISAQGFFGISAEAHRCVVEVLATRVQAFHASFALDVLWRSRCGRPQYELREFP